MRVVAVDFDFSLPQLPQLPQQLAIGTLAKIETFRQKPSDRKIESLG